MSHIESRFGKSIMVVRLSVWTRLIGVLGAIVFLASAAWLFFLYDGDINSEFDKEYNATLFLLLGVFFILGTRYQRIIITERAITKQLIYSRTFIFDDIRIVEVYIGYLILYTEESSMQISKGNERQLELIQTIVDKLTSLPNVKFIGEDKALQKYDLKNI